MVICEKICANLCKMRNILLTIEYDGTNYYGWQVQGPEVPTVQQKLREVLQKVLQEEILVLGASRTDRGVHAKGQAANFKTNSKMPLARLKEALNGLLPQDITVKSLKEVPLRFHAQFDAKEKTYRYTILNRSFSTPFLQRYSNLVRVPLDIRLMAKEAKGLVGKHDFSSFQGRGRIAKSAVRQIKNLSVRKEGNFLYIEVTANGFLYNMVRNIVGTLIEIGRGYFSEGSIKRILKAKNRDLAGPTAPAKGLCLLKVKY